MKQVLLIDDHPMLRAGLVQLINGQPDLRVCCELDSPAEAIPKVLQYRPDLILADLSLPERSGLELIADLHTLEPKAPILVLSMHDESFYAERALRAGARGYIMKQAGAKLLLEAIRRVLSGEVYLSPSQSAKLLDRVAGGAERPRSASPVTQLTNREFEVFKLIGEGKDTDEIASLLQLSRKTVDVHRGRIKRKLGLTSGNALIRQAVLWRELTAP